MGSIELLQIAGLLGTILLSVMWGLKVYPQYPQALALVGLKLLGLVLFGAVLNRWLIRASKRNNTPVLSSLRDYFPVLKQGWQLVRQNIWIFWVIASLTMIGSILQNVLSAPAQARADALYGFIHSKFASFGFSLASIFESWFKFRLKGYLMYGVPHDFYLGAFAVSGIVSMLVMVIFLKSFLKLLAQPLPQEAQPSVRFLKMNLRPFLFVTAALSILSVYFALIYRGTGTWVMSLMSPLYVYSGIVIAALIYGFVLIAFKITLSSESVNRTQLFFDSLRYFRALFFFVLILPVIIFCFSFPVQLHGLLSRIMHITPSGNTRYWIALLQPIVFWLSMFLLFMPYLIVLEDKKWKEALVENFRFWKRRYREIICLFFILIISVWVLGSLLSLAGDLSTHHLVTLNGTLDPIRGVIVDNSPVTFLLVLVVYAVKAGLSTLLSFWVAGVIMVFLLRFRNLGRLPE